MKHPLPETAHPDHLKKQAKNLLKACRACQPDAIRRMVQHHPHYEKGVPSPADIRLQEAQHVIAKEYGYASWPRLMQELHALPPAEAGKTSDILIYTNGQSAVDLLDAAGVPGEKLEWSDVLYDGPVPLTDTHEEFTTLRARHLSSLGFAGFENIRSRLARQEHPLTEAERFSELQLWFEQDLFDQLLLAQLLCRLSDKPAWEGKITLFQFDTYIGRLTPEQLLPSCPSSVRVRPDHINEAARIWDAFRQPTPSRLQVCLESAFSALPHAASSLRRLCEEFPSSRNGLTRTEQQILLGLKQEHTTPGALFRFSQEQEEAMFLGDASFFLRVEALSKGTKPLILLQGDTPFLHPSLHGYTEAFRNQQFRLSDHGERVLNQEANWLENLPAPYWVGGSHIGPDHAFCWDPDSHTFQEWSM